MEIRNKEELKELFLKREAIFDENSKEIRDILRLFKNGYSIHVDDSALN